MYYSDYTCQHVHFNISQTIQLKASMVTPSIREFSLIVKSAFESQYHLVKH